jgi:hypothetical protein
LHNPRHRRAAVAPLPHRAKVSAFPNEVAVPPRRGAAIRLAEPVPPEPTIAALFTVPPRPKAAPKKRKPAGVRRKAQKKAKARGKPPPRGPKLVPALALPVQAEPLVLAATPKGTALVKHRPGGLTTMLAGWIGTRLQAVWDRLGGVPTVRPAPRRKKASAQELELIRLRAENARLKRQMDALLAHPPRPVSKAPNPA